MGSPAGASRSTVARSSLRYAFALAFAHLLSVAEVLVVVVALRGHTPDGARFQPSYVSTAVLLAILCTLAVLAGGVVIIVRSLSWFIPGRLPTTAQRRTAMNLIRDQSLLLAATWAAGGSIFVLLDRDGGLGLAVATGLTVVLGGAAATGTGVLLSQRTVRPIVAAATRGCSDFAGFVTAPGVLARLISMWLLSSGLPSLAIAVLVIFRSNGWIVPATASVEIPVLVLSLVAVMLGWRGMILVSRSIADPIREVVDAMAEIEHGRIGTSVDVYERSEIGRLQSGFNRMVAGL
ncbi:MAG TPA: HAMP domain-containing protein, partial [Mycobacterium sp.]|nr:HAMP domain-containing protein [Mycobacterium sp.]